MQIASSPSDLQAETQCSDIDSPQTFLHTYRQILLRRQSSSRSVNGPLEWKFSKPKSQAQKRLRNEIVQTLERIEALEAELIKVER